MSATVSLTRRISLTGALVRVELEPLGDGQVRIVKLERKPKDSSRFTRWTEEEGYSCPFNALGFKQRSYESVFGGAA